MLVVTPRGLFSVVADAQNSGVVIRARSRADLGRLEPLLLTPPEIHVSDGADFPYRVFVPRLDWIEALTEMAGEIDYPDFARITDAAEFYAIDAEQVSTQVTRWPRSLARWQAECRESLARSRARRKSRPPLWVRFMAVFGFGFAVMSVLEATGVVS